MSIYYFSVRFKILKQPRHHYLILHFVQLFVLGYLREHVSCYGPIPLSVYNVGPLVLRVLIVI